MDAVTRAEAQAVRRQFEDYGLSTLAIAKRAGQSQRTVRGYLRYAFAEPPETRLLWHRAWRSQARAAALKTARYWRQKYQAARTEAAKEDVMKQYQERLYERELHV